MVLLVVGSHSLLAQPDYFKKVFEHQRDSAVRELQKYPSPDTVRAKALMDIMDYAIFLSEKKTVLPYWREAITLSRRLHFRKGEAICLEWMGSFYKSAMRNDSAIAYLDSALLIIGPDSDAYMRRTWAFAQSQKAMIYEGQENYYNALNGYFAALKKYDSTDLYKQKNVFLRIATIYQKLFNDEKALEYYNACLTVLQKMPNGKKGLESEGITTYIAGIYFNRGDLAQAKYYLSKTAPAIPDTVETLVTGGYYHLAGQIALKEKKNDSAMFFLREALKYYEYTRPMHIDVIANVSADMARLKMAAGDMTAAKKFASQGMENAIASGQKDVKANALIALAEYYNRTGNQSAAYQTLQEATLLSDSVLAAANIKQANTLAAVYENDKKEKEIAKLELDKKIQAADVRQSALLNTIFIIAIAALLLIGFSLYLNFQKSRKIERQRIAELEKEKQLMGIEAMLKGQEEERRRLARDLHDGLGSLLSGVKISFSNLKEHIDMTPANTRSFEKTLEQLDRTIAELRKVAHNLMPEALARFGLKSAMKDFCESIRLGGSIEIICEQLGIDRELGNIADVNVYRIVQELINNAINHGKAGNILVQLTKTTDKTLITVEDDGQGFEVDTLKKASGIGWTNIQSRVNYFNGIIDIESKPREGTTVNIELMA